MFCLGSGSSEDPSCAMVILEKGEPCWDRPRQFVAFKRPRQHAPIHVLDPRRPRRPQIDRNRAALSMKEEGAYERAYCKRLVF